MKLGVLSDIHGNYAALAVVLEEFRRQGISDLLFLGDMIGYYPFAKSCLAMLEEFRVTSVRGNHDQIGLDCLRDGTRTSEAYRRAYGSALDRALDDGVRLEEAPLEQRLSLQGRTLLLCHGSPWDALEGRVYPDFKEWEQFETCGADAVLMGHTHYPVLRKCGAVLVLNPGSVGQARQRSGVACAALLDVPAMTASLLELPYDPAALIADARAHDPDLPYLTQVLQR
ncbi:MAG TPA: metallophosphoesterase family protein [Prosthecobacter sp.]|nr:metallophosphoesterase family protein [Prosthecobacter sp.]